MLADLRAGEVGQKVARDQLSADGPCTRRLPPLWKAKDEAPAKVYRLS
jgi:hypothetical protein